MNYSEAKNYYGKRVKLKPNTNDIRQKHSPGITLYDFDTEQEYIIDRYEGPHPSSQHGPAHFFRITGGTTRPLENLERITDINELMIPFEAFVFQES